MTSYTKYFDNTTIISIKAWYDFADNKNQKGHMMIFLWSKIILIESKLKVKLSKKKKKTIGICLVYFFINLLQPSSTRFWRQGECCFYDKLRKTFYVKLLKWVTLVVRIGKLCILLFHSSCYRVDSKIYVFPFSYHFLEALWYTHGIRCSEKSNTKSAKETARRLMN